jgi:sec-independent protein translocase protein TatB
MFDLDAGKILVVGVVALLVIGPKDLPRVLRTVGQTVGRMRRMASEFQNQFMEAIKEADLEEVKKEISAIQAQAAIDTSFDAASVMRDEITSAVEGSKEIGHSTVDLTGTGPMKEPVEGPIDAAPQEIGSLAPAEALAAPAASEIQSVEPPPAAILGAPAEAPASSAAAPAPAEAPAAAADLSGAGPVAPALPAHSDPEAELAAAGADRPHQGGQG